MSSLSSIAWVVALLVGSPAEAPAISAAGADERSPRDSPSAGENAPDAGSAAEPAAVATTALEGRDGGEAAALQGFDAPFETIRPPYVTPTIEAPFGDGPPRPGPPASRDLRVVRVDLLVGMAVRSPRVEPTMTVTAEFGPLHGFSATFHTSLIVAPDRNFVQTMDVPLGFGAVARGRLRKRPLYGSVGLSGGIVVHRAQTDIGLVHRVDPDLRLPLRVAWTATKVGLSLGIIQGYSVRRRSYERRGVEVWSRLPYRVELVLGLHFDIGAGQARRRRSARPSGDQP